MEINLLSKIKRNLNERKSFLLEQKLRTTTYKKKIKPQKL